MLDNEPFASYVLQLPSTLYVIFIFNHDLIIGIFNFYIVCMFDLLWLMLFVSCFRNPRSLPSLLSPRSVHVLPFRCISITSLGLIFMSWIR